MSTLLGDDVKREIGQHFVVGFHGHELSGEVISLIRDYYVGSIIIMKRNVKTIEQLRRLVQKLQVTAKHSGHRQPLLIGIDQENGLVSAFSSDAAGTQFPGAMALAATSSEDLAEEVTQASAKEMRYAGINWVFSPVADVNSEFRNPVIGVRSFSGDPETVGNFSAAVARGLTSAGIAPCAKHFPGHGDTHIDSHLSLPRIMKTEESLSSTEIVPFRTLIAQYVATIMTGHIALPLITSSETPSSLSYSITTNLLRNELGFSGVVVTDCLEMEAVATEYGTEGGAVKALQAGADIAMICHRFDRQCGAIEAAYAALVSKTISLEALQESGKRISSLKLRFAGTWDEVLGDQEMPEEELANMKRENELLSKRAYAASIAWIKGGEMFEPIQPRDIVVIFTPKMERINLVVDDHEEVLLTSGGQIRNTAGPSYLAFAESISKRAGSSHHIIYGPDDTDKGDSFGAVLDSSTRIIFTTRNSYLSIWQIDYLRKLMTHNSKRAKPALLTLVASCAPYDLMNANDLVFPCLCSFEFTIPALDAIAAALFGETTVGGAVPCHEVLSSTCR
ncbi:glycoside hydrolase [Rickenella mellea]|uniref:Glycoside hydrolase n=1 Tax=Rickenella mellea TaxID=50990 RepID=A0A4Y7Q1D3_9AGAM|nr:glycoside hydrolase [Rickenella mellea]